LIGIALSQRGLDGQRGEGKQGKQLENSHSSSFRYSADRQRTLRRRSRQVKQAKQRSDSPSMHPNDAGK
jgi:hypothetical protein